MKIGELTKFYETGDVYMNHDEAWRVLVWFFGGNAGTMPSTLTYNDRSFAQALVFEAVNATILIKMFEGTSEAVAKPPEAITDFLKEIVKITAVALWKARKPADWKNPEIYKIVKDQLARNWRSAWRIRIEIGEKIY